MNNFKKLHWFLKGILSLAFGQFVFAIIGLLFDYNNEAWFLTRVEAMVVIPIVLAGVFTNFHKLILIQPILAVGTIIYSLVVGNELELAQLFASIVGSGLYLLIYSKLQNIDKQRALGLRV